MSKPKHIKVIVDVKRKRPRIGILFTKHEPNKKSKKKHRKAKHKHKEE